MRSLHASGSVQGSPKDGEHFRLKEIKQTRLLNGPDSVKGIIGTFGKHGILEGTLDKSIVTVLNFLNVMVLWLRRYSFPF